MATPKTPLQWNPATLAATLALIAVMGLLLFFGKEGVALVVGLLSPLIMSMTKQAVRRPSARVTDKKLPASTLVHMDMSSAYPVDLPKPVKPLTMGDYDADSTPVTPTPTTKKEPRP